MITSTLSCKTIIVIGASAAGSSAVKELIAMKYDGKIIWIASQKENPYKTTQLKSYLEGTKSEKDLSTYDITLLPANVTLLLGKKVTTIASYKKSITLDDNTTLPYDQLLLAHGTQLTIPQAFTGISGVFAYHTLEHAQDIKAYCKEKTISNAVIVGLGITGLELAHVLSSKQIHIHAIDKNKQIMSNYIPQQASDFLLSATPSTITFHLSTKIEAIESHKGHVTGVTLTNGKKIPCELVVFTTGSAVDTSLLHDTAIEIKDGGIVVNEHMQTKQPSLYAAGDCTRITDLSTGLLKRSRKWKDAEEQGKIAAQTLMGKDAEYKGSRFFVGSHFLGFNFQMYGSVEHKETNILYTDNKHYYHLFNVKNGMIQGYVVLDKHELSNKTFLKESIEQQKPITFENLKSLSNLQSNQREQA